MIVCGINAQFQIAGIMGKSDLCTESFGTGPKQMGILWVMGDQRAHLLCLSEMKLGRFREQSPGNLNFALKRKSQFPSGNIQNNGLPDRRSGKG